MTRIFSIAVLASLALFSFASRADGECDAYRTSYDRTYCTAKLFLESDKELNAVYGELRALSDNATRLKLKDAQLSWIRYRDATCESDGSIDVDCNYRENRVRAEYLRDRVRECKAGTCRDDMTIRRSWN